MEPAAPLFGCRLNLGDGYNDGQGSDAPAAAGIIPVQEHSLMDVPSGSHPSADILHAFGLGKLDAASAAAIKDHLETCPDCRYEAAILTLDSSLEQESQSDQSSSSSAAAPALVSVSSSLPAPVAGAPS